MSTRGSGFRTGSSGLSRDLNRVAVLRLIGASGPIARIHIAQRLGLSPATVTASTATASKVPSTLTRPGRTEVAPSRAAVNAGNRYSWPTELWPIWSCDCNTIPANEASVPAATKPSVT